MATLDHEVAGPVHDDDAAELADLERSWRDPPGLRGWLTTVDHKRVGLRYIVTAMVFFVLAGIEALVMRVQLARPQNGVLDPDKYNQFFTCTAPP